MSGTKFFTSISNQVGNQREDSIFNEIKNGNHPSWIKPSIEIMIGDENNFINFKVSKDYLSIGTDDDYIRSPLMPMTAQKVADLFDCSLPTAEIVNLIWEQAEIKLSPSPMPPTSAMATCGYYIGHSLKIDKQLVNEDKNKLVAGHKKDVVLSEKLAKDPKNVAIYGWHQSNGKPIQPLSTVHKSWYMDYSHGIRLISNDILVNGIPGRLSDALKDSELSKLISSEGKLSIVRIP